MWYFFSVSALHICGICKCFKFCVLPNTGVSYVGYVGMSLLWPRGCSSHRNATEDGEAHGLVLKPHLIPSLDDILFAFALKRDEYSLLLCYSLLMVMLLRGSRLHEFLSHLPEGILRVTWSWCWKARATGNWSWESVGQVCESWGWGWSWEAVV